MAEQPTTPAWDPGPDRKASVELPAFLAGLTERLAREVHDRWARQRMAEGWSYGPERDEARKTTPNLVPYDSLPEAERDVDRGTALATLRAILSEGYTLVPGGGAPREGAGERRAVELLLENPEALTFEAAEALRRSRSPDFWAENPDLLLRLAKRASDAGWPLMVFDMVSQALARRAPGAGSPVAVARLRYLEALSLVEVGAIERAEEGLAKIDGDAVAAGDLQGLRGRLAKMRGLRAHTAEGARACFEQAEEIYEGAYREARDKFRATGDAASVGAAYYLGINAAAMGAWAGRGGEAMAREVLALCDRAQALGSGGPWLEATRGEAHLLLGDPEGAGAAYRAAAKALRGQWRPLQSMRRQALETARRTGFSGEAVEGWFDFPELHVAGLGEGRAAEPPRGSIVFFYLSDPRQLERAAALAGSAAEFHLGTGEPLDIFRARLSAAQAELFDKVLGGAARVLGQNEIRAAGAECTPVFTKLFFRGLAVLRARELGIAPCGLPSLAECGAAGAALPFRALLCADAKGYSRLGADGLRVFCRDFLGCVGGVIDGYRDRTITVKTAGDGLFAAFRDVEAAIRCGLALRDATAAVDWAARGFPEDLGLRISLDAGPVMEFVDPVTGRADVAGQLVNRAARIEPVTPVQHVYASRTMAALAAALDVPGVRFEYAGETALPKGYGTYPLYHLTVA